MIIFGYFVFFQGCFATFTSASKLNRHQNSHSVAKPFLCTYDECDSSFKRRDNLNQHIKMHHTGEKIKCPFEGILIFVRYMAFLLFVFFILYHKPSTQVQLNINFF